MNDIVGKIKSLYYQKENFSLFNEDSFSFLEKIPDNSVDMIFADPPYFLSNNGITCSSGKMVSVNKGDWDKEKEVDDKYNFNLEWIKMCSRILKESGTIWISGTLHNIYSVGFALEKLNLKILNNIIWYKPNASPNLSCRYFTHSTEIILWARKGKNSKHTFNYE